MYVLHSTSCHSYDVPQLLNYQCLLECLWNILVGHYNCFLSAYVGESIYRDNSDIIVYKYIHVWAMEKDILISTTAGKLRLL